MIEMLQSDAGATFHRARPECGRRMLGEQVGRDPGEGTQLGLVSASRRLSALPSPSIDDPCEYGVGVESLELALEPQQHAMSQRGQRDGRDVLDVEVGATGRSPRARAPRARATAAHAGSRHSGCAACPDGESPGAAGCVASTSAIAACLHRSETEHRATERSDAQDVRRLQHGQQGSSQAPRRATRRAGCAAIPSRGRARWQLEHEPVELRFGQGIRALELDRVLRREHAERLRQRPAGAGVRDLHAPASLRAARPASAAWRG